MLVPQYCSPRFFFTHHYNTTGSLALLESTIGSLPKIACCLMDKLRCFPIKSSVWIDMQNAWGSAYHCYLQSSLYWSAFFLLECGCGIVFFLLAVVVLSRTVLESRSGVNTYQTAQHKWVLANDPIASVILWKTWRVVFLNSGCLHQIVGKHRGRPRVWLDGYACGAADYSIQADQITERLAKASYPRSREMIFHCHNSLDWITLASDSDTQY